MGLYGCYYRLYPALVNTKTRLFKYIENFTTKNWKFSDKNSDIFHIYHENMPILFWPPKPHFYIVKLGFTGVFIIFLISAQNIDCVYSSTHNLCFDQKYEKISEFLSENFQFLLVKFSVYLNMHVFVISTQNIDCGYPLEPPRRGGSNEYPQSMFLSRNKKNNVYPCKPQF